MTDLLLGALRLEMRPIYKQPVNGFPNIVLTGMILKNLRT